MITNLLTESQHISDVVRNASYELFEELQNLIKTINFAPVNDLNKFIKTGNTTYRKVLFDNASINFNIVCFNFTISDEFDELSDYYAEGTSVCIDEQGKYFISNLYLVLKNGTLEKQKNLDTISHELLHIYEQNKLHDEFREKFPNTTCKTLMFSSNEIERKLGEIFYLSSNSEQDSFLNGAYNEMMCNLSPNVQECFKKTVLYRKLEHFRELKEYFEHYDISELLNRYYGITYNYFLKYINKKYEVFKKKTSVVLYKVMTEKLKQNWR